MDKQLQLQQNLPTFSIKKFMMLSTLLAQIALLISKTPLHTMHIQTMIMQLILVLLREDLQLNIQMNK